VPSMVGDRAPIGLHGSTSLYEEGEEEDDERRISVVVGPVGASVICQTACISISPWGRTQGPLAPWTTTMPPTSLTPSLITSGPPSALPSSEAGPSGSGTPPISRVYVATGCSIGSLTTLPHLTKAECPGCGTRWSGLVSERPRKNWSCAKEQERVGMVRC
jgi:hypothetical protein